MAGHQTAVVRSKKDRLFAAEARLVAEKYSKHRIESSGIAAIGIPTFNRVEGLQRALKSYIDNANRFDRKIDFVIIDGSLNAGTRKAYREMLFSLREQHQVDLYYAGLEEKLRFAKKLIEHGELPPNAVKFSLFDIEKCGQDYGVSRNALFMHLVDDRFLSVDDDTVCSVALSPERDNGITFVPGIDPGEIRVFPDREAAQESVKVGEHDFIAIHEPVLGEDCSTLARRFGFSCEETERQCINAQPDGRVLITYNGWTGDCAWGSPIPYLILTGESFRQLTRSEADYRAACTSREILRYVSRLTLSDATAFMMTIFAGFDNRTLLPPFFPVKRGEDTVFGLTFSICLRQGYAAHLPGVLHHSPVENRKFWQGEIFRSSSGIDLSTLISACIKSTEFSSSETDNEDRLRCLGMHLQQMASSSTADFEEFAHTQVLRELNTFSGKLRERLKTLGEAPKYWADDVERYIEVLESSLANKQSFIPLDLLYGRSLSEAGALAQRLVRKFGQLLHCWPEIMKASRSLRLEGCRLAGRV